MLLFVSEITPSAFLDEICDEIVLNVDLVFINVECKGCLILKTGYVAYTIYIQTGRAISGKLCKLYKAAGPTSLGEYFQKGALLGKKAALNLWFVNTRPNSQKLFPSI